MFDIAASIVTLLWFVGRINAQQARCDYLQDMVPGQTYYVYNDRYPQSYIPGVPCRWVARSDRPIKITCNEFKLPLSEGCAEDALTIQDGSSSLLDVHCGEGSFSFTSKSNEITITLKSSSTSPGGRFSCTAQTMRTNCICGSKNPNKIYGGIETGINEFPMMVGLVDVEKEMIYCGATIINERQVLTAAHCVSGRNYDDFGVLIGAHDVTKEFSKVKGTDVTKIGYVESVSVNSLYNSVTQDYDIAIITLNETITFNHKVRPVCLPFQHSLDDFADNNVRVLGWGSIEFGGAPSDYLQKVTLSVLANDNCRRNVTSLTDRQLCTYGEFKDSCQFDSGGPVLWQNPISGRLVLIGVVSTGSACGDKDPAVNARVTAFLRWILDNTLQGIKYCNLE